MYRPETEINERYQRYVNHHGFFWSGIGKWDSVAKQLFPHELQNSVQNEPNTKNSRRPDKSKGGGIRCELCIMRLSLHPIHVWQVLDTILWTTVVGSLCVSDQKNKTFTLCLSKVTAERGGMQQFWLHTVYWALNDKPVGCHFCATIFLGGIFTADTYRQGKSESHRWVAAFCFAFVSK